jgi:NlpC/P60 family putative phage cell wall peptidase
MDKDALRSGEWRQQVVREVRTWLYTPYRHKGRVKGVGVDCGGLLYEIYNPLFGPFAPFPEDYAPDWALHKDDHELYLNFIMPYVQEVEAPVVGGFSLFKYGRAYSHAAIYTDRNTFIHAWGDHRGGMVKENKLPFFVKKDGGGRMAKHFDVSEEWLDQ